MNLLQARAREINGKVGITPPVAWEVVQQFFTEVCGVSKPNTENKDFILTRRDRLNRSGRMVDRYWSRHSRFLSVQNWSESLTPTNSRYTESGRHPLTHTYSLQVWCRVCGAYVMGRRPGWVSGNESRAKSLDLLTRFKTDEPYVLIRKYPCFATRYSLESHV